MRGGPEDWRGAWSQTVGEMLLDQDGPTLVERLIEGIAAVVPFSHSVVFGYPIDRRPVLLHNGLEGARRHRAISAYVRGTYLVDPFYEACRAGIADGVWRMSDVAPDDFFGTVGAHPGYVSPCVSDEPGVLSEEIGFLVATEDGGRIVLSLMREALEPPFAETEMMRLREMEPVVLKALLRGFSLGRAGGVAHPRNDTTLEDVLERAEAPLSKREREVARLLVLGHSTESISLLLGIAGPTVKIHRRNLYAKLGVATQAEFFSLFLRHLCDPDAGGADIRDVGW
jgi:DNA-binding CsgD family transcriptional regulator